MKSLTFLISLLILPCTISAMQPDMQHELYRWLQLNWTSTDELQRASALGIPVDVINPELSEQNKSDNIKLYNALHRMDKEAVKRRSEFINLICSRPSVMRQNAQSQPIPAQPIAAANRSGIAAPTVASLLPQSVPASVSSSSSSSSSSRDVSQAKLLADSRNEKLGAEDCAHQSKIQAHHYGKAPKERKSRFLRKAMMNRSTANQKETKKSNSNLKTECCVDCKRQFSDHKSFITHRKTHVDPELVIDKLCFLCGDIVKDRNCLENHFNEIHQIPSPL